MHRESCIQFAFYLNYWVALIKKDDKYYYFDSFGVLPCQGVRDLENDQHISVIYSTEQFQKITDSNCGQWCAAFIMAMKTGTYEDFINNFTNSTLQDLI